MKLDNTDGLLIYPRYRRHNLERTTNIGEALCNYFSGHNGIIGQIVWFSALSNKLFILLLWQECLFYYRHPIFTRSIEDRELAPFTNINLLLEYRLFRSYSYFSMFSHFPLVGSWWKMAHVYLFRNYCVRKSVWISLGIPKLIWKLENRNAWIFRSVENEVGQKIAKTAWSFDKIFNHVFADCWNSLCDDAPDLIFQFGSWVQFAGIEFDSR